MKPNSFSRLYAHIVFSPKGRTSLLTDSIREKTHKYIYGVIVGKKCHPIAINGPKDHIHILINYPLTLNVSDLIRDIKRSSSLFINDTRKSYIKFGWQEGFGAFSVGYRELEIVKNYILDQNEHHKKTKFNEEYFRILKDEGIQFEKEYVFEFYEDEE